MTPIETYLADVKTRAAAGSHFCDTCGGTAILKIGDSGSRYYKPAITSADADRLVSMVEEARESFDLLMLFAMDEDNVWDLERANEVRAVIRESARSALARIDRLAHGSA